jgi:HEPN domain-containing protein
MIKHNNAAPILAMARKDFAALQGMVEDVVHFSDEIFGFHAEQAVEKGLKAWIAALNGVYPFTHDLSLLLNELIKLGGNGREWLDLLELASFGVQFRYEEISLDDEPLDRSALINRIDHLLRTVETVIFQNPLSDR